MKVLVTGGCGFVGSHLVRQAKKRGHDVTAADLSGRGQVPDIALDVRDTQQVAACVAGYDVVIHSAAVVGPGPAKRDPILAVDVNISGTANVLEAARVNDARVVYLSTATLYGHRPDLRPLSEAECWPWLLLIFNSQYATCWTESHHFYDHISAIRVPIPVPCFG